MIVPTDFEGQPVNLRKFRKRIRVSDHAVLGYLEQVMGVSISKIRRQILTDGVVLGMALGARSVRSDDHQVVIQGRVVTTILTLDMAVRRRRRKAWPKLGAPAQDSDQ